MRKNGVFRLLDPHRQTTSTISMSDWFHRPQVVEKGRNLEELTMSMTIQNLEETDNFYVEEVIFFFRFYDMYICIHITYNYIYFKYEYYRRLVISYLHAENNSE